MGTTPGLDLAALERSYAATAAKLDWMGQRYPVYLTAPPPGHEIVPSAELFSKERITEFFERALLEWTDQPKDEDRRAAASRFLRRYCGTVMCAAMIPLGNGVSWDVSLSRVSVMIRDNLTLGIVLDLDGAELVTSPDRPTTWPVHGTQVASVAELRERAVGNLVRDNLRPIFDRINEQVKVAHNLQWATLAEQLDQFGEVALIGLGEVAGRPFVEDRDALLFGDALPGVEGPNPLRGLLSWERLPGYRLSLEVRNVCCAQFVVKSRPIGYCRTCGLISQEERLKRWEKFANDEGGGYLKGPPQPDSREGFER